MVGGWARVAMSAVVPAILAVFPNSASAAEAESALLVFGGGIASVVVLMLGIAIVWLLHRERSLRRDIENSRRDTGRALGILSASPLQYYVWNRTHGTEEASAGLAAFLGLPVDARLSYADLKSSLAEKDAEALDRAVKELRISGKSFDIDTTSRDRARSLHCRGDAANGVAVLWLSDRTREAGMLARLEVQSNSLRRLLDALPIPVWQRDGDLALTYGNRAYAAAVDISGGAQEPLPELTSGTVAQEGRALAIEARESGRPQSQWHHVVMGGRRRYVEITETPLPDSNAIAGYALDRTDIEDVQADLTRHIEGHEGVLHNLGTAIAIYGADERLEFYNNAFMRLWGLEESWLGTRPTLGEVLEALRDRRKLPEYANFPLFKMEQQSLFTSLIGPLEELSHLPDGTTCRSIVTPHPLGGLLFTWEDVTDALALERSYNTLIAVQRETLDNLYEGVAVIGSDGRLNLSNPAFGSMWQLPEKELEAQPHISDLVERMREFLEEGVDWESQRDDIIAQLTDRDGRVGRIERTDGSVLDFATVPLPDGAVLLSYLDVSDSIRVERALRERNEALETADQLKSEFIANVSYELRTPLNTIIGFAEILTGQYFGTLNDRQMEYSQGILESSHRLLSLINDILDLAMIEAGHIALDLDTIDIKDVLTSVLNLTRERIRNKNLQLDVEIADDLGSLVADERRIKQAVFNILSNSIKFTPENGRIVVTAHRTPEQVILSFIDNGIGIEEGDRSRVFGKFERGSNPEARRSGAGLGLSLVKSFIELHGGIVRLDSEPGAGTKVTCILPLDGTTSTLLEDDRHNIIEIAQAAGR